MRKAQPEDGSRQNQYAAEVFYREQIADYLQGTAEIQIVRDPSNKRNNKTIGVIGLRLRLDF